MGFRVRAPNSPPYIDTSSNFSRETHLPFKLELKIVSRYGEYSLMVKTSVCDTDVVSSILATYPNAEMADWLCSGLQPRLGRFNSGSLLQTRPIGYAYV